MSVLCLCMRDSISVFNSEILGSVGLCFLVVSRMCILFLTPSGRSLHVGCIFPLGTLCLSACRMIFVSVVFAVCMFVGGSTSAKAASVSLVYCSQLAFL